VFCSTPSQKISADESGEVQYYTKEEVDELVQSVERKIDGSQEYKQDGTRRCYYCGRNETEVQAFLIRQAEVHFNDRIAEKKEELAEVQEIVAEKQRIKESILALAAELPSHILDLKYSTLLNDLDTFSTQYPELTQIVEYRKELRKSINPEPQRHTRNRSEKDLVPLPGDRNIMEEEVLEAIRTEEHDLLHVSADNTLRYIISLIKDYTPKSYQLLVKEQELDTLEDIKAGSLAAMQNKRYKLVGTRIDLKPGRPRYFEELRDIIQIIVRDGDLDFDSAFEVAVTFNTLRGSLLEDANTQRRPGKPLIDETSWNELLHTAASEWIHQYLAFEYVQENLLETTEYIREEIDYSEFKKYMYQYEIPVIVPICAICRELYLRDNNRRSFSY
jgi:hypothetical protein